MKDETRPITARALTSVMDVVRPVMPGAAVLDLFAGHGRFSESALKEGASRAVLVESNSRAIKQLRQTLSTNVIIVHSDVFSFLKTNTEKFEIIFLDPPFHLWNPDFEKRIFDALKTAVNDHSLIIVKHPKKVIASPTVSEFHLYKTSVFGDSKLLYYRYGT